MLHKIILEIENELTSAKKTFPDFHSPHEGYAVIKEELDEMWDAIKQNNVIHSCEEAKQVAAMAIRYIIDCIDYKIPVKHDKKNT